MIEKILNLATAGSTLAGAGMMHRFLSTALNTVMTGMACIFAFCIFFVSALILAYYTMVHCGIDASVAGMSLSAAACLMATLMVAATSLRLRKIRCLYYPDSGKHDDKFPDIKNVATAFISGFLNSK